jgi:bacterial/archaeal transporter family-2 protein
VTPDQAVLPARSRFLGAVVAASGGLALAVQGRLNGQLGHSMGDGVFAALISFGIGAILLVGLITMLPTARAGFPRLGEAIRSGRLRWWQCLGGACGAFLVAAQGLTVAILGVAVFTVAVVAGQVVSSLAVDRAGLGPGPAQPITVPRATGACVAVAAVVVAVSDHTSLDAGGLWWALLPAVAGLGLAWQLAVNGRVRLAAGHIVVPTLVNFAVGTAALLVAATIDVLLRGWPATPPGQWWLYLGGPLGIGAVLAAVIAVRLTGVLLLGLSSVAGQLLGAVLLDLVVPTDGGRLSTTSLVGTAITMLAVAIAAIHPRPSP